jgi:hypothetical protein
MAAKSFYDMAKETYVTVAHDEFGIGGKPATISRIAILTGLTWKEVQALLHLPFQSENRYVDQYNRAARVITGWLRDPDFGDGKGHPLPLRRLGNRRSFGALIKRYSGDIPVRAMLDELVRVGAVRQLKDGRIVLVARGYIPQKDMDQKFAVLGQDTSDLTTTIDHNLYESPSSPRIQRKVMYDNVPWKRPRHSMQSSRLVPQKCLRRWIDGFLIATAMAIIFQETLEGFVSCPRRLQLGHSWKQVFEVNHNTVIDEDIPQKSIHTLKPGLDVIVVTGLVAADGQILARLSIKRSGMPHDEVQGVIKNHDAGAERFEIGQLGDYPLRTSVA